MLENRLLIGWKRLYTHMSSLDDFFYPRTDFDIPIIILLFPNRQIKIHLNRDQQHNQTFHIYLSFHFCIA